MTEAQTGRNAEDEAPEAEAAPTERADTAPAAPAPGKPPHKLKRKTVWLMLTSLMLILGGAAVAAAPFATTAPEGWIAAAFAVVGAFLLLEAFACPGWRGTLWRIVQGMALTLGGLALAFGKLDAYVTPIMMAGGALAAFGAAGLVASLAVAGSRGWLFVLLGGLVAAGASAAMLLPQSPLDPLAQVIAAGAALVIAGLTTTALALAARKT